MNFGLNLWNKAVCRIHGLVVIEGMNLSGHPWIINEIHTVIPQVWNPTTGIAIINIATSNSILPKTLIIQCHLYSVIDINDTFVDLVPRQAVSNTQVWPVNFTDFFLLRFCYLTCLSLKNYLISKFWVLFIGVNSAIMKYLDQ